MALSVRLFPPSLCLVCMLFAPWCSPFVVCILISLEEYIWTGMSLNKHAKALSDLEIQWQAVYLSAGLNLEFTPMGGKKTTDNGWVQEYRSCSWCLRVEVDLLFLCTEQPCCYPLPWAWGQHTQSWYFPLNPRSSIMLSHSAWVALILLNAYIILSMVSWLHLWSDYSHLSWSIVPRCHQPLKVD